MRKSSKISQANVQRVVRGVISSGVSASHIAVDPETGVINVYLGKAEDNEASSAYDQWVKKQNAR